MGFVIITTSRNNGEPLVMVDRSKQKASFWSSCLEDAFIYADRAAAETKAKTFKFNNPRVMDLAAAKRIMPAEHWPIADADDGSPDLGWDAHKEYVV